MQILVATLRGAVHQQQRSAAYAALLPSLVCGAALTLLRQADFSCHAARRGAPTAARPRTLRCCHL